MRIVIVALLAFLGLVMVEARFLDKIGNRHAGVRGGNGETKFSVTVSQLDDDGREKTFTLDVAPSDTIKSVRTQIQEKQGIPTAKQVLYYNNDELYDSYTVSDYDIKDGSIITLIVD